MLPACLQGDHEAIQGPRLRIMGQAKDKHGVRKNLAKVLQHFISSRWLCPWINAELLCVTRDATACEQVAGAMPFLTSNRFQIEERERYQIIIKTLENRRFRVSMSDTKILVPIAVLEDHGRNLGLEIFGLEIYAIVVERCKVAP